MTLLSMSNLPRKLRPNLPGEGIKTLPTISNLPGKFRSDLPRAGLIKLGCSPSATHAFPDFLRPEQEAGPSTTSLRCKDFAQDDNCFRSTVFGENAVRKV